MDINLYLKNVTISLLTLITTRQVSNINFQKLQVISFGITFNGVNGYNKLY